VPTLLKGMITTGFLFRKWRNPALETHKKIKNDDISKTFEFWIIKTFLLNSADPLTCRRPQCDGLECKFEGLKVKFLLISIVDEKII